MTQERRTAAAVAAALAALATAAPTPAQALTSLGQPSPADPSGPLVAAAALLAWALAGWLVLVLLVVAASRVPGWSGRCAGAVAARVAPRAVRRLAEVALGVTVATGAVAAPQAFADGPQPLRLPLSLDWPGPAPAGGAGLDWPGAAPTSGTPRLDWPGAAAPAPVRPSAPAAVVVRPGDTLWGIAADHLPTGAGPAAIAQAWPAWWSANRAAIGSDPDLIHPGTPLVPPTAR